MSPLQHPRENLRLEGIATPAAAFESALGRGRLHHAWLLTGPQGLGKASFAYRAARRLLGARPDLDGGPLGAAAGDPVCRMIAAQSHPDLIVLERDEAGSAARKSIPVDEARRLPAFFAKAPAVASYRVAIIDAADDMNPNAANAVLKTLEEPSARGVLLLVAHAPGRLLPTLRSRCRRLGFSPWSEAALADFAAERLGVAPEAAARLAAMAHGAPGRLLALAEAGALEVDATVADLMAGLPDLDRGRAQAMADGFRGGEGVSRFALALDRLGERLHAAASDGRPAAAAWARLWSRTSDLAGEVEGLNLDRGDAFWSLLAEVAAVARRDSPPC